MGPAWAPTNPGVSLVSRRHCRMPSPTSSATQSSDGAASGSKGSEPTASSAPAPQGAAATASAQERLSKTLSALLKIEGIACPASKLKPGVKIRGMCPHCKGGTKYEPSLSVMVYDWGGGATFRCFRATCDFNGDVRAAGATRVAGGSRRSGAPFRPPVEPGMMGPPNGDALGYFAQLLLGTDAGHGGDVHSSEAADPREALAATLAACGVQQADGIIPELSDKPSAYIVMPHRRRGAVSGMVAFDLPAALKEGASPRSLPKSTWVGNEQVMWGYDDAVAVAAAAASGLVLAATDTALPDLIVVGDVLERLALVHAGLPPGRVVALPQGALERFAVRQLPRHSAAPASRERSSGNRVRPEGGRWGLADDAVEHGALSYAMDCEDLFNGFGHIVLALRTDAVSVSLAEELARVIGMERCSRLRWPASAEELWGSSPHSADHGDWLRQLGDGEDLPGDFDGLGQDSARIATAVADHVVVAATVLCDGSDMGAAPMPSFVAGSWEDEATEAGEEGEEAASEEAAAAAEVDKGSSALIHSSSPVVGDSLAGTSLSLQGEEEDALLVASPLTSTPFSLRVGARDMLHRDGGEALLWHVQNCAEEWPLEGLFQMSSFLKELLDYYHQVRRGTWFSVTLTVGLKARGERNGRPTDCSNASDGFE